jgi:hypothetical protein
MEIKQFRLKTNGYFSIVKDVYSKEQHPNQQGGLDQYVDVLDHHTGQVNSLKLYENSKGLHFKKGSPYYLSEFTDTAVYVPYQIYLPK